MPPRPSRRVDLHLCPADADQEPPAALEVLLDDWRARAVITADGGPGPRADALVRGGFARVRVDRPGRLVLYANGQGGFRVTTPEGAEVRATDFEAAARGVRSGGRPVIVVAGREIPLRSLNYAPPAAWARWAIVIADVASLDEGPAVAEAEASLGPLRKVARRVG